MRGVNLFPNGDAAFTCFNCPDRHPGCHPTCEKYNKALAEYREQEKARRHREDLENLVDDYQISNTIKIRRRFSGK